ncbi:MAG: ABC transporter permease [Sphaerochaetaceae bacterium]|jgi:putative spermidine/putrescine transport system permease protein|nr:ABC transporter permease [Spirochaetales bacterium]
MSKKRNFFFLSFPTTFALLVLFVAPMVYILINTLEQDGIANFVKFLTDSFYLNILKTTVIISLKTTGILLLLGYPTAYFLARTTSKLKNTMMIIILFPFLVSAVVRSYGWMVILGNKGLLNQFLLAVGLIENPLKIMYTSHAVIVGLVHLLLPYMILSITGVIQGIDKNLEYAASSLGCNPLKTFFKVLLPLSTPGIISGCTLVFTLSMTAYVTPRLLGGANFRMMSTMVFQEVNVNFNWGLASAISYILMFVILLFLVVFNLATASINQRVGGQKHA